MPLSVPRRLDQSIGENIPMPNNRQRMNLNLIVSTNTNIYHNIGVTVGNVVSITSYQFLIINDMIGRVGEMESWRWGAKGKIDIDDFTFTALPTLVELKGRDRWNRSRFIVPFIKSTFKKFYWNRLKFLMEHQITE